MADEVREPIQTYLTAAERTELDRVAAELGVSRSEALRRGIVALRRPRYAGSLRELTADGLVTPPTAGGEEPGEPPPSRPVAALDELLDELARDRRDR